MPRLALIREEVLDRRNEGTDFDVGTEFLAQLASDRVRTFLAELDRAA